MVNLSDSEDYIYLRMCLDELNLNRQSSVDGNRPLDLVRIRPSREVGRSQGLGDRDGPFGDLVIRSWQWRLDHQTDSSTINTNTTDSCYYFRVYHSLHTIQVMFIFFTGVNSLLLILSRSD